MNSLVTAMLTMPTLQIRSLHSGYAMVNLAMVVSLGHPRSQTATALSTGEAEYYGCTHAGREIIWLQQLLHRNWICTLYWNYTTH